MAANLNQYQGDDDMEFELEETEEDREAELQRVVDHEYEEFAEMDAESDAEEDEMEEHMPSHEAEPITVPQYTTEELAASLRRLLKGGWTMEEVAQRSGKSVDFLKLLLVEEEAIVKKTAPTPKVGKQGYNISARARELFAKGMERGDIKRTIEKELGRSVNAQHIYSATTYAGNVMNDAEGKRLSQKDTEAREMSEYRMGLARRMIPHFKAGFAQGTYSKRAIVRKLFMTLHMEVTELRDIAEEIGLGMTYIHIRNNVEDLLKERNAEDPTLICKHCRRSLKSAYHREKGAGPHCLADALMEGMDPRKKEGKEEQSA